MIVKTDGSFYSTVQDSSCVMKCRSVVRTHARAVTMIAMAGERVVAGSLDCAVTVIRLQGDGAVMVTHLLQVHTQHLPLLAGTAKFLHFFYHLLSSI